MDLPKCRKLRIDFSTKFCGKDVDNIWEGAHKLTKFKRF
jgi:hypothetical protein